MPSGIHPFAKPRHRLKSTMTKLTAVDWGRGIEENQVPARKLIPVLPHHCSDRAQEPRTDTGGRGDGNINVSFIRAPHPASAAVWKHNCNENSIDRSCFLLDKLHCFSAFQLFGRQLWRAKMKPLETQSSVVHHNQQTLDQLQPQTEPSAEPDAQDFRH